MRQSVYLLGLSSRAMYVVLAMLGLELRRLLHVRRQHVALDLLCAEQALAAVCLHPGDYERLLCDWILLAAVAFSHGQLFLDGFQTLV